MPQYLLVRYIQAKNEFLKIPIHDNLSYHREAGFYPVYPTLSAATAIGGRVVHSLHQTIAPDNHLRVLPHKYVRVHLHGIHMYTRLIGYYVLSQQRQAGFP